jgi:hypothetical protein
MGNYFATPLYPARVGDDKITIDVTNSISFGLPPNKHLMEHVLDWMEGQGVTRILDFGGGVLRHTIPLLKRGFDVTVVEYQAAFARPTGQARLDEARKIARRRGVDFNRLIWPDQFLRSRDRYDVALLIFVLQVVPIKKHREVILDTIAGALDPNGPRRLYYAGRYGEAKPSDRAFNDGWVRGDSEHDRSFYTEWNSAETDRIFSKHGFSRAGTYKGPTQGYIYMHGADRI